MNWVRQIADELRRILLGFAPAEIDSWIALAADWALLGAAAIVALVVLAGLGWAMYATFRAIARPAPRLKARAPKQGKEQPNQSETAQQHQHWSGLVARMQTKLEELVSSAPPQKPPTPAQLKQIKEDEQRIVSAATEAGAPADVFRELGALRALQNTAGAIEAFEAARALDSSDFWTRAFLSRLYERAGRAEEAQQERIAAVRAAATAWQLMEYEDQILSADETLEQLDAARRCLPEVPETLEALVKVASNEEAREFAQLLSLMVSLGARFVDRDLRTGATALEWSMHLAAGLLQRGGEQPDLVRLGADKYLRERLAHLISFEALESSASALIASLDALAGENAASSSPSAA